MEKASLSYRAPLPGVAVGVCVEDRRLDRVAVELPDGIQRLGDVAPVDSLISTRMEVVVVGIPFVLHLMESDNTAAESDREDTEECCSQCCLTAHADKLKEAGSLPLKFRLTCDDASASLRARESRKRAASLRLRIETPCTHAARSSGPPRAASR